MRRAGTLAIALALSCAACASTTEAHHFRLGPPAAPTTRVDLFDGVPARSYAEAGFVQAFAYGATAGDPVVRALSNEARAMGCDAVVRVRLDLAEGIVHAAGVCVRWVELPPAVPAGTNGDP